MGLIKCLLFTFSSRLVLLIMLSQPPYPFVSPFFHTHIFEDAWASSKTTGCHLWCFFLKAGSVRYWQVLVHCSFSSFHLPRAPSNLALSTSREGASTTCLGSCASTSPPCVFVPLRKLLSIVKSLVMRTLDSIVIHVIKMRSWAQVTLGNTRLQTSLLLTIALNCYNHGELK